MQEKLSKDFSILFEKTDGETEIVSEFPVVIAEDCTVENWGPMYSIELGVLLTDFSLVQQDMLDVFIGQEVLRVKGKVVISDGALTDSDEEVELDLRVVAIITAKLPNSEHRNNYIQGFIHDDGKVVGVNRRWFNIEIRPDLSALMTVFIP